MLDSRAIVCYNLAPITGTVLAKKKALIINDLARTWPKSLIIKGFFVIYCIRGFTHQNGAGANYTMRAWACQALNCNKL